MILAYRVAHCQPDRDWTGGRDHRRGGGIQNADDTALDIRLLQARALREQGMDDAALEVYKDALRSKKRDPELLKEPCSERGRLLLACARRAYVPDSPQGELGKRVGRPRTQIARWEQGAVDPGFGTLRELLRACGFDLHSELVLYEPADNDRLEKNVLLAPERRVGRMLRTLGRRDAAGG